MIRALACALVVLVLAASAAAEERATIDDVEQVFVRWMKQHRVARGALAVAHGDRLVLAKGYGGLTARSRTLIASLSKPITGVCTATLIQDGKLRLDTTLGEIIERDHRRFGTPRDARLRRVTIEQLLTHHAGFGRTGGDPVTGATLGAVLGSRPVSQATMHHLVPGVMRARLEYDPGAAYAYTNAPHLLLGIAIEAITGRAYADYCASAVLRPLGIRDAALHPRWAVLGSFGGWNLSGAEYLAFLRAFAPGAPVLGDALRAWTLAGGPYSLMFVRAAADGRHDVYHAGSWGYRSSARSPSGEINDSIGTRAMRTAFGASWYVAFEPRPPVSAREALDRELYRTASAVRVWPETDLSASMGLR